MSPTGPIALPTGYVVDPLAAPLAENPPAVQQPDASLSPVWPGTTGWFGSGFARGSCPTCMPKRVALAVGTDASFANGRVYVASAVNNRVYVYDAVSLAPATPASFDPGLTNLRDIAFWNSASGPELYVLGNGTSQSNTDVNVFDANGNLKRSFTPRVNDGSNSNWSGLDVAWGEIWLTRGVTGGSQTTDVLGQDVAVFDATTGAFKGESRDPLGSLQAAPSYRSWWDVAVDPALDGAIIDNRLITHTPVLPGVGEPGSPLCTAGVVYPCDSSGQRGSDAVWGMNWFLQLVSPGSSGSYVPVEEYSVDHRSTQTTIAGVPLTIDRPGYYLTLKRTWSSQQQLTGDPQSLSDIAYQNRDVRIDWWSDLAGSNWLRSPSAPPTPDKCLHYVVSDADFFIAGDKGEHWYEQARNFDHIDFYLDGVQIGTSTHASSEANGGVPICINTKLYANWPDVVNHPGAHLLRAVAVVAGKTIDKVNANLRVDNAVPTTSTLNDPGQYVNADTTFTGTASDAHSGISRWVVEGSYQGGPWAQICQATAPTSGSVDSCTWNTANASEGSWQLRARAYDNSSDGGNDGTSTVVTTVLDKTPPTLTNTAPDVLEDGYELAVNDPTAVDWTQTDATSGIGMTTVDVNSAGDGSANGSWISLGSSGASGDTSAQWQTQGLPGGLYLFRAHACDRAGNCQDYSWQGELAAAPVREARAGQCSTYCYASRSAGTEGVFRSFGTSATITTPGPIHHQSTYAEHTAAYVDTGAGPWAQTGINTDCANSQSGNDYWGRYVEVDDVRGTRWFDCFGATGQGGVHTYKIALREGGRRSKAYIDGALKIATDDPDTGGSGSGGQVHTWKKRGYLLGTYGSYSTQATGEVTNPQRQMAGYFSNWLVAFTNGAFTAPGSPTDNVGRGYALHAASATRWCVVDTARSCSP